MGKVSDMAPRTLGEVLGESARIQKRMSLIKGNVPGSYEHQQSVIAPAVLEAAGCRDYGGPYTAEREKMPYGSIVATFPDYAIVGVSDASYGNPSDIAGKFFKVPYQYDADADKVTTGEPEEVEQVYRSAEDGIVVTDETGGETVI